MTPQKFRGRDIKEALVAVKNALGEEALVLSTRQIRDGVFGKAIEIEALADAKAAPQPGLGTPSARAQNQYKSAVSAESAANKAEPSSSRVEDRVRPLEAELRRMRAQLLALTESQVVGTGSPASIEQALEWSARFADSSVKSSDSPRAKGSTPKGKNHPASTTGQADSSMGALLTTRLLSLGFSLAQARRWSARIQQGPDVMTTVEKLVWDHIDLAGSCGYTGAQYVMCVGPSGAGKTTTIAKWAAKAALSEDKRIAIITMDNFRAGAFEQLSHYVQLIGCDLQQARSLNELGALVEEHSNKDLVFIDTAGRHIANQDELQSAASMLRAKDKHAEVHLALPCMFSAQSLRQIVANYRRIGVDRLCLTKADETSDFSALAAVVAEERLPLSYWTIGQRIPDDLELASLPLSTRRIATSLAKALLAADAPAVEQFV